MMMDNERRADLGIAAIRAAASVTNVWRVDNAETSIRDVLAYIAHVCDRVGLDPCETFAAGLLGWRGDFEDGPPAAKLFDGNERSFASMLLWGE
jgi:hypothetical protein